MALEVEIKQFADEHAAGAYVLDVREPEEYAAGHVPGAVLIPLDAVAERLPELPTDRRIHVICASGNRSGVAAARLARAGYQAVSVAGGTAAWARAGGPLVTGMRER